MGTRRSAGPTNKAGGWAHQALAAVGAIGLIALLCAALTAFPLDRSSAIAEGAPVQPETQNGIPAPKEPVVEREPPAIQAADAFGEAYRRLGEETLAGGWIGRPDVRADLNSRLLALAGRARSLGLREAETLLRNTAALSDERLVARIHDLHRAQLRR